MDEAADPDADPYDVLQDLLEAGRPGAVVLRASPPFLDFADYAEMDEFEHEFADAFRSLVDDLSPDLGGPRFVGDKATPGFPAWSDAHLLAVWIIDERAAYVAVEHRTQDEPFELTVGLR